MTFTYSELFSLFPLPLNYFWVALINKSKVTDKTIDEQTSNMDNAYAKANGNGNDNGQR